MLPYANRLTKKEDYEAVYRKGKPLFCDNIMLKVLGNTLGRARVGVVVGVKFSKKAVRRNRIKRQIRQIIQNKLLEIRPDVDIAINIKRIGHQDEIDSQDLEKSLLGALKKGNLIK